MSRLGLIAAATLALAAPTAGRAQGVPVIDTSSIAQLVAHLEQMRSDFENQVQQLEQLREQYATMRAQLESLTGPRGMSELLNGATEIAERRAADSLGEIVDGAISGDLGDLAGDAARIAGRIGELRETFGLGDIADFHGAEQPNDRAIAEVAGAGMAAVATGEDAYARSNGAMERVGDLIGRIDDNADLKASVDFNSRMLAEVAVLLNETLRVQAAMANAQGADALSTARDLAAQRKFMRIGDAP